MTTEELIEKYLTPRNLRVVIRDGKLGLVGGKNDLKAGATPALLEVVRIHRQQLLQWAKEQEGNSGKEQITTEGDGRSPEQKDKRCPKCGKRWLVQGPPPDGKESPRCSNCGYRRCKVCGGETYDFRCSQCWPCESAGRPGKSNGSTAP